jgi:phosphoadenosine phosphosulfate reductase
MPPANQYIDKLSPEQDTQPSLFSEKHLKYLNEKLAKLPPQKILEWAIVTLPGLYQTTAFGLTGKLKSLLFKKRKKNI